MAVAQNNFRIHLEFFPRLGKSSKPVGNLFRNSEKFPNIFKKNSKCLEKFANIFKEFFPKVGKSSKYIQIKKVWKHNIIYEFASAASQIQYIR